MNFLWPRIHRRHLPSMVCYAIVGAGIAGVYGIVHDQVTYTISPEYFSRLKFDQFDYADFGFPPRVFAAEIGFLATWWVGLFTGWFIARVVVPVFETKIAWRLVCVAFLIVGLFAASGFAAGYAYGLIRKEAYVDWTSYAHGLGVADVRSFVRVAYIHNAGYLGGLVGLLAALLYLHRIKRNPQTPL